MLLLFYIIKFLAVLNGYSIYISKPFNRTLQRIKYYRIIDHWAFGTLVNDLVGFQTVFLWVCNNLQHKLIKSIGSVNFVMHNLEFFYFCLNLFKNLNGSFIWPVDIKLQHKFPRNSAKQASNNFKEGLCVKLQNILKEIFLHNESDYIVDCRSVISLGEVFF